MEVTHTATLGYQEITITQTLEPANPGFLYSARLKHTRALPWDMAGISSELIEGLDSFLETIEINPFLVSQAFIGGPRNNRARSINTARLNILGTIRMFISDAWGTYRGIPPGSDRARIAAEYFCTARPSLDRFLDGIIDRAVTLILDFIQDDQILACPDNIEDCGVIHFTNMRHELAQLEQFMCPEEYLDNVPFITADGEVTNLTFYLSGPGPVSQFNVCYSCDHYIHPEQQEQENLLRPGAMYSNFLCSSCYTDIWNAGRVVYCYDCEEAADSDFCRTIEIYEEFDDCYDSVYVCERCARNRPREDPNRLTLNNYSYKPDPIFHVKEDKDKERPFMGMELEVARETTNNTQFVNRWINKLPTDLFYVKSDSSVYYGMEIVTHPFTWTWAQEEFPYQLFDELIAIPGILPKHDSAGTHIHVEKAAFDEEHMWKFLLFFCENPDFFGMVGERGTGNHYGSFTTQGMRNLKANVKKLAQHKGDAYSANISLGRDAINLAPPKTIELRFCAGNVYPHGIKKNQQLVHSVFEFTKKVPVAAVEAGALADAGYFLGFLEDNDYPELQAHIEQMFPKTKKLEGVS